MSQPIDIKDLNFIKLIGKGTFAEVYLVKDIKNNKLLVAKKLNIKYLSDKEKFYLQNEINILKMFQHPNIIKLYTVIKNPNSTFLILEYCSGDSLYKNLYEYIKKFGAPFPEKLVQKLMRQILLGVQTLHENGIIHRDIKLENILIKYNNDYDELTKNLYNSTIKIIDFNMSCKTNVFDPKTIVGTPINMAPTIVKNMNNGPKIYNEKVDIWSLGTICYEMIFGKPLFSGFTQKEVYQKIVNNKVIIPKTISVEARKFLYKMLRKDGFNRLSASELLKHDFIIKDYHTFHKYNNENKINFINNRQIFDIKNTNINNNGQVFDIKNTNINNNEQVFDIKNTNINNNEQVFDIKKININNNGHAFHKNNNINNNGLLFNINNNGQLFDINNGKLFNINNNMNNNGQLFHINNNNKHNKNINHHHKNKNHINNNEHIFKKISDNKIRNKNNDIKRNITPFKKINYEKCNGCNLKSFFETSYKCTQCADVLYCQNCYQKFKNSHLHTFEKRQQFLNAVSFEPKINVIGINNNGQPKLAPPKIEKCITFQNDKIFNKNIF